MMFDKVIKIGRLPHTVDGGSDLCYFQFNGCMKAFVASSDYEIKGEVEVLVMNGPCN